MITIAEGDKRTIYARVKRKRGAGAIALTNPERRILTAARAVAENWAAASWDATTMEISALFDSTVAALSTPAVYYMQLRGVIGPERYTKEVKVTVTEIGP